MDIWVKLKGFTEGDAAWCFEQPTREVRLFWIL